MRLLALRVGPAGPAAALLDGPDGAIERERAGARAEALAGLVRDVLAAAGLEIAAIGALAVETGPGSFTATRGAVAAARALALATGLPVHALSIFEVVAGTVPPPPPEGLLVLAPAGRGLLAAQRLDARAEPEGGPAIVAGEAATALVAAAGAVVLVDPPEALVRGLAGPHVTVVHASAAAVARAAAARRARGRAPVPGSVVRPLYLRPPDARPEAGRPLVAVA